MSAPATCGLKIVAVSPAAGATEEAAAFAARSVSAPNGGAEGGANGSASANHSDESGSAAPAGGCGRGYASASTQAYVRKLEHNLLLLEQALGPNHPQVPSRHAPAAAPSQPFLSPAGTDPAPPGPPQSQSQPQRPCNQSARSDACPVLAPWTLSPRLSHSLRN